ncbi:MAG: metalloregulator ArsR/SmtB family transcription factor [Pseudomonadota bacterium]
MDIESASQGFAAIGSEQRLAVLLMLVKAGRLGMTVGQIQEEMGMAPSTLAHHLRMLADGKLIIQRRDGRSVINRANFDHLEDLGSYLMRECCAHEIVNIAKDGVA